VIRKEAHEPSYGSNASYPFHDEKMAASMFTKTVPSSGRAHLALEDSSRLWLEFGLYR
jgi:hypothetical protein